VSLGTTSTVHKSRLTNAATPPYESDRSLRIMRYADLGSNEPINEGSLKRPVAVRYFQYHTHTVTIL